MSDGINMNEIVGTHDILFLCLDCLRYDVALGQQEEAGTPVLNQFGPWEKRGAAGNFTYPAHHAMFAGFLPTVLAPLPKSERAVLFFQNGRIGTGRIVPPQAFAFKEPTFIQGLAQVGYETVCIGGVAFFAKRSALGKVLPAMFKHSFWNPSFGCTVKNSPNNQIAKAVALLSDLPQAQRVMMYINFDAIHYPNYFYLEGAKKDSLASHAAALRYIDRCLPELFAAFRDRGPTFVIVCADHGTCYEEVDDGYSLHGFNHDSVNTVPYKHFIL